MKISRGRVVAVLLLVLGGPLVGRSDDAVSNLKAEAIREPLPWPEVQQDATVRLALSRSRFHAEDGHLDVILERADALPASESYGTVTLTIRDETGAAFFTSSFPAPGARVICYPPIPAELSGRSGMIEATWHTGEEERGRATAAFRVKEEAGVAREGRVRLSIPNPTGASVRGLPQTVGVPFPRGALYEESQVRLLDGAGREIPLQTKVTGRWSRFGPIRWLQCDFTVDLAGGPAELFLEYGPDVRRASGPVLRVVPARHAPLVPLVETGMLRLGPEGLAWDPAGMGNYRPVLGEPGGADESGRTFHGGLRGAFVEREDGTRYEVPFDHPVLVEESGPEKAVLRRGGWTMSTTRWGDVFCRFETRYVVHRGSPLVRVFHTWIYTGDANEDRIRSMGWAFHPAAGFEPAGILTAFGENGEWIDAPYIVQHDFDKADIGTAGGEAAERPLRVPGVMAMEGNGTRLYFGAKHFWENYPREVGFENGAMVFYEWPRHGRRERRETTTDNMMRLWFAHEGEVLDFRPSEAYGRDPIYSGIRHERYWPEGQPEAVNAQGVAKTAEFWLYLTDDATPPGEAERVLQGLAEETLRAVVDPVWMAGSGAFYEMHPLDRENFAADEEVYERHALAPLTWAERMGIYGKWVWGNMLWSPNLQTQTAGIYRGFRKGHHGWPYSWVPFARSGDARYLRFAEAATRTMTDVNFCHFSDRRVHHRPRGEWYRGALPWTGSGRGRPYAFPPGPMPVVRGYSEQCDYHLHAWLMTGYRRAKDVLDDWSGLVKEAFARDGSLLFPYATAPNPRRTVNLLKTYVEMYDHFHDPWFIMAAHVLAQPAEPWTQYRTHSWQSGNREYHRFTGCEEMARYYLEEYTPRYLDPALATGFWGTTPQLEPPAYAYELTGDPLYLRRVAGWLSDSQAETYGGEPGYWQGWNVIGGPTVAPSFTSYYLQYFPMMLSVLHRAGYRPAPLPAGFYQGPAVVESAGEGGYHWRMPTVALRKESEQALPLRLRVNVARRPPTDPMYAYTVSGPDGEPVLEGTWDIREEKAMVIPAGLPAGTYRVRVEGVESYVPYGYRQVRLTEAFRALLLPLSEPGVPEVLEPDPEHGLGTAFYRAKYWVYVPADCEAFDVYFTVRTRDGPGAVLMDLNRVAVYDADGREAWAEQHAIAGYDGPETVYARISVPAGQRGRLWRIAAPGWSAGVRIGAQLPRALAVSPDRWFEPEGAGGND